MQVLGYSERGVINSFFYEMAYTHKVAFQDFLNLIQPMIDGVKLPAFEAVGEPTIYIEQSFSNFGDADAVILFEDKIIGNTVLFIEAKVCAEKPWNFKKDVIKLFEDGITEIRGISGSSPVKLPDAYTSNLLIQLYHKFGMINNINSTVHEVYLPLSPKFKRKHWMRSIGDNETVLEVYKEITDHINKECNNVYYIGIVPSGTGLPLNPIPTSFTTASTLDPSFACFQKKLGYITWQNIYDNIVKNNMPNTDEVFKLNQAAGRNGTKNQIYNP